MLLQREEKWKMKNSTKLLKSSQYNYIGIRSVKVGEQIKGCQCSLFNLLERKNVSNDKILYESELDIDRKVQKHATIVIDTLVAKFSPPKLKHYI